MKKARNVSPEAQPRLALTRQTLRVGRLQVTSTIRVGGNPPKSASCTPTGD